MERYEKILRHGKFLNYLKEIEELEKDRQYCKHSLEHLVAVARTAYITVLERKLPYSKDIVYAAALLHDIGRVKQYKDGTPHDSDFAVETSVVILKECGYTDKEICVITEAIRKHRAAGDENENRNLLPAVLYAADKRSRNCYACMAAASCNWPEEKRNRGII